MDFHVTRQGETVDLACHRHYGRTRDTLERVLEANPGLAGLGPTLPAGTTIAMPPLPAAAGRALARLWE